jgi:hypothetical protein
MRFAAKGLLPLFLVASCAAALCAQTIQIKVVDGKTGRSVKSVCVGIQTKDLKSPVYIPTDKNGVAWLSFTHKNNEIDIFYNPKLGCGGTGVINPVLKYIDTFTSYTTGYNPSCAFPENMPGTRWKEIDSISTNEVFQHGFASANTCGKVTASPQPGQVILFVRPRNSQEKRQDCKAGEFPILCW